MLSDLRETTLDPSSSNTGDPWEEAADLVRRLPLYRGLYGARAPEFRFEDAHSFPILERASLIGQFPGGWMTERLSTASQRGEVEYATSSGTTGERVQIVRPSNWWVGEHQRACRAVPRLRGFRVGVDRSAVLTTMDCSAAVCFAENPRFADRVIGTTLYLNSAHDPNHWTRDDVTRILIELSEFQPKMLVADPTFLALLLQKAALLGISTPIFQPEILKLSYEMITGYVKRYIGQFIHTPVTELHGTTELGWLYHRESDEPFTRISERSAIELVPFCKRRNTYEILASSVKNAFMPFVRFRLGDVVKLEDGGQEVRYFCGRVREAVANDAGDPVTPGELDEALAALSNDILLYQVTMTRDRRLTFHYVGSDHGPLSPLQEKDLRCALTGLFGNVRIELARSRQISPGRSGKFSLLRCE
ncbi:hypothetical protein [Pendulispora albinea]|uniref:CoF synthetase n=1 Tax=Pendulispora albinea TaxID=2741071 RepID=A0ABZ2LP51_9BACT